ncbi:MAG: glycosyltransferase [Candidatus Magasanikbacteria bacterium]|nr:glycosyltransferase [Candidatus Magasanikbacteria bacterium]
MKKTILYLITQSELGGAQKYILDLCLSLKSEYNVIVAFGEQGEQGGLALKLKENEIDYYVIPALIRKIDAQADFFASSEIIKLIKKVQPDIIHLNSSKISVLGALAIFRLKLNPFWRFRVNKIKVIYTVHGWVFHEPGVNAQKYKKLERWAARFKNTIICVSQMDYDSALKEKIAPQNKLVMIHNGIAPVDFLPREQARLELQLETDDFVIGSIGYLYKNKGYEYLINATKILVDNGIKPKTIIIGEGEERGELENWIRQYRLEKYVILKGAMDAAKYLKAFDIYVCSSVKEGLSYTIIEAMSAARPIIATDVGGNSELIENEKTGLLVNPEKAKKSAEQ